MKKGGGERGAISTSEPGQEEASSLGLTIGREISGGNAQREVDVAKVGRLWVHSSIGIL